MRKTRCIAGLFLAAAVVTAETACGNMPQEGPVALYSFEGSLKDCHAVERVVQWSDDGIVDTADSRISFGEGMVGQAAYLDGSVGIEFDLTMKKDSYTFSYWMMPEQITNCTASLMITPKGFENEKFINVTLAVDGLSPDVWTHVMNPDERYSTGGTGLLQPGQWSYVTVAVDGSVQMDRRHDKVTLYVDGKKINDGQVPKDICIKTSQYWFGINIWDELYRGYVDEVAFYDYTLSAEEVWELYIANNGEENEAGKKAENRLPVTVETGLVQFAGLTGGKEISVPDSGSGLQYEQEADRTGKSGWLWLPVGIFLIAAAAVCFYLGRGGRRGNNAGIPVCDDEKDIGNAVQEQKDEE